MSRGCRNHARGAARVNGIAVLAALVVAGMGITGGYYHYKAPRLLAEMRREQADAPKTPEARVARWLDFGRGLIHQRLLQLRMSPREPWLVTHTLGSAGAREVWGVDFTELSPAWSSQRGMQVVVTLPEPRRLGTGELRGDNALNVPNYAIADLAPDARERAVWICTWALERLSPQLAKDIPSASLVVEIAPSGGGAR